MSDAPQMIYAPIAGRGELTRLIAAAGELQMQDEISNMANFGKPVVAETGESKKDYISPSGMPLLKHGDLKISQSGAIEMYLSAIAPKYSGLSVQQRAVDNMYSGIKEEMLFNCAKAIFTTQKTDKDQAKKDVIQLFDKWLGIFEEKVPVDGFIQGLSFPTVADLALLNVTRGFMPFGAAAKLAEYDFNKWAKVRALCDRTAAYPPVAEYLKSNKTMAANPMGF
eukprot:gnl/MRDRNA2_/MRDRNA2_139477_c0_seq1.p1 gnl/MRDRNA2_/MRDRNA2_139477_c0~~gnl/MRDRNA2_/MRDRNA2_139477_c0_seq1.p1  ORF type:complete len:251 (+),score=59.15 gnl/MRDRNA2_/MRDRNA2_139477_c0_seq1:84-755(+)